MFDKGDRVTTPGGPGKVVYRRMKPPTYSEVDVYSVKLDTTENPSYYGSLYPADKVEKE